VRHRCAARRNRPAARRCAMACGSWLSLKACSCRPFADVRRSTTHHTMTLKPATKLKLAVLARPMAIAFAPVAILLMAVGASFVVMAAWLVANGMLAFATACPRCRQSIYWNEQHPWKAILAEPHVVCTRCSFDFQR